MSNKSTKGLREYWRTVLPVEEAEPVPSRPVLVTVCDADLKVKGRVFCEGVEVDEESQIVFPTAGLGVQPRPVGRLGKNLLCDTLNWKSWQLHVLQ